MLADDSTLFRSGLARLLSSMGVDVCAEVGNGEALVHAVAADPPDAVVVDIRMPPNYLDEGLVTAETLRRSHPDVAVLVLSTHVEASLATRLLSGGSTSVGYLLKDRVADVAALHDALRRLVDGQAVIDPEVVDELLELRARRSALIDLSPRELDVLRAMAEGRSNVGVATALHLSERTVENYAARIFTKLGLDLTQESNRRVQAVLLWLRDPRSRSNDPVSP
ncbi:response regulator [Actinomycetospora sp. CA-053990]|uniref:response regulator n=1 Tax=Actinomycetospora sp. CA-053990 TaxID=3239891 RepID=UPI003D8D682A